MFVLLLLLLQYLVSGPCMVFVPTAPSVAEEVSQDLERDIES